MPVGTEILLGSLVLALAGAGTWWFLRDDALAEVSLDAAVSTLDDDEGADGTGATEASGTGAAGAEAADGIAGTWTVDAATGDFDYERATGTLVGFRIGEELASMGPLELQLLLTRR